MKSSLKAFKSGKYALKTAAWVKRNENPSFDSCRWKGQAAEEEPHVEESVVTVVVKDGVQTGQPRVRIIETVSIATQTEKVAILAAAVQVGTPL